MSGALPRSLRRRISGFGNFPVEECDLYRPERLEQLQEIVANAPQRSLLPRGLGRAYGDAALNRGAGLILNERLNRMLDFDPETGELWCEAAVSLAEILDVFLPRGFFFPVTPGTKNITIGGAIAADVHGKNHHRDGAISAFLKDFRLLLASGEILECSRDRNPEAFWATVGGMGLTGVVLDARLRLKPVDNAFVAVDYEKAPNLDAVLESFESHDRDHVYTVAWVDCLARGASLGRAVVMRANHAHWDDLPPRARRSPWKVGRGVTLDVPFPLPNFTLNKLSVRLFNAGFYHGHRDGRVVTDCNTYFYPLDSIPHWNRLYGTRGVVQYQVVVPRAAGREAVVELLEAVSAVQQPVFLSVLKPFGEAGEGLLSFPRPGFTLSLDLPNTGASLATLVARLDRIVLQHGGSIYLAKDSVMHPDALEPMYPKLGRFREVKAKLDPDHRFSSSLARRLRVVEE